MLAEKRLKIGSQAEKLKNGLNKLEQAREDVKIMTIESDIKRTEVTKKSTECDALIQNADKESKDVAIKQKQIDIDKIVINKESATAAVIQEQAERELAKA